MITVDSIWIDFDMCKLHSSLLRPNSQKNPPQWLLEFAFKYLKIERGMWKKNTFIYRLCIILLCKDLEIGRGMGKTNKLTGEFNLPHGILEILDFKAVLLWSLAYAGGFYCVLLRSADYNTGLLSYFKLSNLFIIGIRYNIVIKSD